MKGVNFLLILPFRKLPKESDRIIIFILKAFAVFCIPVQYAEGLCSILYSCAVFLNLHLQGVTNSTNLALPPRLPGPHNPQTASSMKKISLSLGGLAVSSPGGPGSPGGRKHRSKKLRVSTSYISGTADCQPSKEKEREIKEKEIERGGGRWSLVGGHWSAVGGCAKFAELVTLHLHVSLRFSKFFFFFDSQSLGIL